MSHESEFLAYAVASKSDFRTLIHRAIDFTTQDLSAAGGFSALGLIKSTPNSGQHVRVGYFGIMKAIAGAVITTPGYPLTTAASGYMVAAVSGSAVVGRYIAAGTSLGMACASGDMITGLFNFANARPLGGGSGYI